MKGTIFSRRSPIPFVVASAAVALLLSAPIQAPAQSGNSGMRAFGQATVEPAIDDTTGGGIYLLTPNNAPLPSKANSHAVAPLYLVMYPLNSTINPADLNCQPTNCDHANVLPFPNPDYGALDGSTSECTHFNGGNPCSPVEGHDHLVGIASTGGDFNVAWHVELVLFSHAGFMNGAINNRVTTDAQIWALVNSGDAFIVDTPITFNCSRVSARTYQLGTPIVVSFP